MNKILVLKDVAYAAKVGGGLIASYNDVDTLAQGALAIFDDNGVLVTLTTGAPADSKYFTLVAGRAEEPAIVPIVPRRAVEAANVQLYRACTKPILTIATTLVDGDVGDISVSVKDITDSSKNFTRSVTASLYKKASLTASLAIDALVAQLNATGWLTAAKTGGGPYNITVTPVSDDILIGASAFDLLEDSTITTSTPYVASRGKGADILQMEKDASTEEGNGNYTELTDLWYKRVMEALTSVNYDAVTLSWEGSHASPTRSHNVMKNTVVIATPDGITPATPPASNQAVAEITALLQLVVATAYDVADGTEPVLDDGTETDGTP